MNTSVYAIPGLFQLAELTFDVPIGKAAEEDERGYEVADTVPVTFYAQLDRSGYGRRVAETQKAGDSDLTYYYQGHIVRPQAYCCHLKEGMIGKGLVKGRSGRVKLVPVEQSSIAGIEKIFGHRIALEFRLERYGN